MLATFSLYNLSLWLHISAAVVGLGATFALSVGFPLALKLDARYLPFVHHLSMDINRKLASPALGLLIVTGIYQGVDSDRMDEPWIARDDRDRARARRVAGRVLHADRP